MDHSGDLKILTKRLALRPFAKTDIECVHEYASDPDVCRFIVYGPNSLEESKRFVGMAIAEFARVPCGNLHLAIVEQGSGELIGACGLEGIAKDLDADLGYCLNRRHWNKGYATEAARALIAHGFVSMALHRIHATCRPANRASVRVLEKAGMQREGYLRENRFVRGKWEDSLLYSIVAGEWKPDS
jgi:[ribosomal protein S5]-alanine N-acetyltransferase